MLRDDDYYETPPELFAKLTKVFGPFDLDVCAQFETAKVPDYYSIDEGTDALSLPWSRFNFCNPPYSRGNKDLFIKKACEVAKEGCRTTIIIPARVGTATYKEFIWKNPMCFQYPLGRVKFHLDGKPSLNSGRDDIMVVVFFPSEVL